MVDPDWAPVEYIDSRGKAAGVTSEYLNRLHQLLNVQFEPVREASWGKMLKELEAGNIYMSSCLMNSPERRNSLLFTPPYISIPTGIFTRSDVPYSDIHTLESKKVAVCTGYAIGSYVKSKYPRVQIVEVENRKSGLSMVSSGKAFAYIDSLPAGCHGISACGFSDLRLTGETEYVYKMSMAASAKHPLLASILDKALNSISAADRESYYEKWFSMPITSKPDYSLFKRIIATTITALILFGFWNWRLDRTVKRRTLELERANAQLQIELKQREEMELHRKSLEEQLAQAQKMESIGRLAGGVAHDFNNMLGVIIGHCELLRQDLPDNPEALDGLNSIQSASERARLLTQQLLAFSRKQVLMMRVLDLNHVVRGMETMLQRLLPEDIHVTFEFGDDISHVKADPSRLEQVLMNLCVNSKDAMQEGGSILIRTSQITATPEFLQNHPQLKPGNYATLIVSDTGTGMSGETISHIFDPFFTTKEVGKGTGLGLAMVYGILKQHNGEIDVESYPGHGTTFTIYLSTTTEPLSQETETKRNSPIPRSRGEIILVVEDEPSVRNPICQILRRLGYNIIEAQTAEESLDLAAKSKQIDLLLTDVVMPGLNGRQVRDAIVAIHPKITTLFMSGYTQDVISQHGVLEEGISYIAKPFTEDNLHRKIQEVLGGGRGD